MGTFLNTATPCKIEFVYFLSRILLFASLSLQTRVCLYILYLFLWNSASLFVFYYAFVCHVCVFVWLDMCMCVCSKDLMSNRCSILFRSYVTKANIWTTVPLFFFLSLFLYVCGRLFHFNCLVHCFDGSLDSAFTKRNKGSPMLPEINVWQAILPGHVDASLLPCLKRVTTLTFIRLESYFSKREKSSGKCRLSY